jgi:hypothetical protein
MHSKAFFYDTHIDPDETKERPLKIGKAKVISMETVKPMLPEEFQSLLDKEMAPAKCAVPRKNPTFLKRKVLSSAPSEELNHSVKAAISLEQAILTAPVVALLLSLVWS